MENPWNALEVPGDDYVHPMDRAAWPRRSVLPPQPYLGSFHGGKVMWLLGGFGTGTDMAIEHEAHRGTVLSWAQRNLGCESPSVPNLWIDAEGNDPTFKATRDVRWWRKATGALFGAISPQLGESEAWLSLSMRLFVLEAFPYPAKTRPNCLLPSHAYTAHLLSSWIESGRPIVVGRAERFWCELVPSLRKALDVNQAIRVRNVQAASISVGNLAAGSDDFSRVVKALLSE